MCLSIDLLITEKDFKMYKQVAISSIKLIKHFLNTLKMFPSESDFNNQKADLHLELLKLLNTPVSSNIFATTSNLMTTINMLNNLNYKSSYYDFVQMIEVLHSIRDELENCLDDVE